MKTIIDRYSIIISPPREIVHDVFELRSVLKKKYGRFDGGKARPHITIANFKAIPEDAQKFLHALEGQLQELHPFKIQIPGYSFFNQGNIIYLSIEPSSFIDTIYHVMEMPTAPKTIRVTENLHMTISKGMKNIEFAKAQYHCRELVYEKSFEVYQLKVLKFDPLKQRFLDDRTLKLGNPS